MGSEEGDDDEKPIHRVYLDAFYMDTYEVTVEQYGQFLEGARLETPLGLAYHEPTPTSAASRGEHRLDGGEHLLRLGSACQRRRNGRTRHGE